MYPHAKRELVVIMTENFDELNESWSKSILALYQEDFR